MFLVKRNGCEHVLKVKLVLWRKQSRHNVNLSKKPSDTGMKEAFLYTLSS